jgi:hypothetical protein
LCTFNAASTICLLISFSLIPHVELVASRRRHAAGTRQSHLIAERTLSGVYFVCFVPSVVHSSFILAARAKIPSEVRFPLRDISFHCA